MANTDLRRLSPNWNLLSPHPPIQKTSSSCGPAHLDGFMTQYSYDKWLRPRPNNQWQNLENQIFVDQTPLSGQFQDDDGASEDDEEDDASEEVSDVEESDNESEDEDSDQSSRRIHDLPSSNRPQLPDDEVLETELNPTCQLAPPGSEEEPNQRTEIEGPGPSTEDDGIVSRFLTVMEELAVKDRDLHRDSIARLGQFFKKATLRRLEEASREIKGSRILLEDRNLSGKIFRPYPRSMTLKQLYEALKKLVRILQQHILSRLTTTEVSRHILIEACNSRDKCTELGSNTQIRSINIILKDQWPFTVPNSQHF